MVNGHHEALLDFFGQELIYCIRLGKGWPKIVACERRISANAWMESVGDAMSEKTDEQAVRMILQG